MSDNKDQLLNIKFVQDTPFFPFGYNFHFRYTIQYLVCKIYIEHNFFALFSKASGVYNFIEQKEKSTNLPKHLLVRKFSFKFLLWPIFEMWYQPTTDIGFRFNIE